MALKRNMYLLFLFFLVMGRSQREHPFSFLNIGRNSYPDE